jgi:hypothetical protein
MEEENLTIQEEESGNQNERSDEPLEHPQPEGKKGKKSKRKIPETEFEPEKVQKILKTKKKTGAVGERWAARRKERVLKKPKKSRDRLMTEEDEENRLFESDDEDMPNKQIFRDASSPRKRRPDGETPVNSSEEDSNDEEAIRITGRDLGYNSNDSEDGDTIPLRKAKRKAREYEQLASTPKRMMVSVTTGITPTILEKLDHNSAKRWIDGFHSLGPSGNNSKWTALIKDSLKKKLGLRFAAYDDNKGRPWVSEEDPESYLKWSAAKFEERLLKIFPDKGQRPADADSIIARVSSIPCHFRAEQNFESATAYLEYDNVTLEEQAALIKLVLSKIKGCGTAAGERAHTHLSRLPNVKSFNGLTIRWHKTVEKALKAISESAQWFDTPRNNQREDKKREDKKGGKQPQGSNQPSARPKPGSAPRNTAASDTVCDGCGRVNHTSQTVSSPTRANTRRRTHLVAHGRTAPLDVPAPQRNGQETPSPASP